MLSWALLAISCVGFHLSILGIAKSDKISNKLMKAFRQMIIGVLFFVFFLTIPFQVWKITGSSSDWNGLYIIGLSFIVIIVYTYIMYGKRKKNETKCKKAQVL